MIEITCPYCDNAIEVIEVVVQDSLRGQNKENVVTVDIPVGKDILYIDQKTWNVMSATEKSKYEYIGVQEQFRQIIVKEINNVNNNAIRLS